MADFERSITVGVGADAAFAFLSDPARIPSYVPVITHVETEVEEGELEVGTQAAGGTGTAAPAAGPVRFLADGAARRVEWGRPGSEYAGSITVEAGTASTSQVVVRLHTRDDVDADEVRKVIEQAARNLLRLLSGR